MVRTSLFLLKTQRKQQKSGRVSSKTTENVHCKRNQHDLTGQISHAALVASDNGGG